MVDPFVKIGFAAVNKFWTGQCAILLIPDFLQGALRRESLFLRLCHCTTGNSRDFTSLILEMKRRLLIEI
jgi:hypothetical protein